MAICRNEKAVIVTKHVERPRNEKAVIVTRHVERPRRVVANHHRHQHHHHHHHHVHHTVKREVTHYRQGADGKRFINRRIELLQYSQRLRESARTPPQTPLLQLSNSSNKQQPETKALSVKRRPKDGGTPACLGSCLMLPNIFASLQAKNERKKKSGSTSNKMKSIMISFEAKKKPGFFSKLFPALRKKR